MHSTLLLLFLSLAIAFLASSASSKEGEEQHVTTTVATTTAATAAETTKEEKKSSSKKRQRRRLRHHQNDKEPDEDKPGKWQVLDDDDFGGGDEHDRPSSHRRPHRRLPSCIVAQMRASLVIPIRMSDGSVKNKTIVIPDKARARGKCGSEQQWLTLVWKNQLGSGHLAKTGQITFLFTKREKEGAVYLTRVWATVALFLEEESGVSIISSSVPSQNLIMAAKDTGQGIWRTPLRFSFVCHSRLELHLEAHTLPLRANSDDFLIVEPVHNEEAYLVFSELQVETFRERKFSPSFTHLKYDCTAKWAYAYIPALVASSLVVLVLFALVVYRLRVRLGLLTAREMEAVEGACGGGGGGSGGGAGGGGGEGGGRDVLVQKEETEEEKKEKEEEEEEVFEECKLVSAGHFRDFGEDEHHADASASSSADDE